MGRDHRVSRFGPRRFYENFSDGWTDSHPRFLSRPHEQLSRWNVGHHDTDRYNDLLWRNSFHNTVPMNNYGYISAERPPPRLTRAIYSGRSQRNIGSRGPEIEFMSVQIKRVAIEEKWVGAVIGKNGVTIQRIEHSCGVSVKVESREKSSGNTREVLISGPVGGIDQAQLMIRQIMEDAMSRAERRFKRN